MITPVSNDRRARLLRLSHIIGCRLDPAGYSLLSKLKLVVSHDGKHYWLTERGIDVVLIDEVENPYR